MPRQPKTLANAFGGMKAEYAAMTESRFRRRRPGVTATGGSADTHYASEANFIRMREYVRAMDRDDFLIGQLTDRAVDNQVQSGFTLEPQTGDSQLDLDIWHNFNDWAVNPRRCDTAGDLTFAEMERLVARQEYIDGDIFILPIDDGTLQLIEADRCRTPTNSKKNIVHGVELDGVRRRQRYYFTKEEIGPYAQLKRVSDTNAIDAYDEDGNPQVFQVYKPSRVSLTRGVTAYKAVIDLCGMIEDTNFATVVKQQIAACAVWSWEKTDAYGADMVHGERDTDALDDGSSMIAEGVSPGQMFRPPKGMKLSVHSPNIPGEQYFPHIRMLLTFVGIQIGMPLVMVLMDASETNFSGWRGAINQAEMGFRCNQNRRKARFYRPVYEWFVRRLIATDPAIAAKSRRTGVNIFRHKWNAPTWPYIQPEHDAKADAFQMTNLLDSPRGVAARRGRDIDDIIDETVADNSRLIIRAIKAAQRIEKKTGVSVHWRDVANRDVPKGGQTIDTVEEQNTVGGRDKRSSE